MQRRILSLLCVVAILMGMITMPAAATTAEGSLQDQVNAYTSGVITLTENAEDLKVDANTYIDLNGHSIAGITVADGATVYVSDSQTDDYTVADGVYGAITGITGAVEASQGYVAVEENNTVSFHRVDLAIKSMSLRPGVAGVYYTSSFAADEVVSAKVESYGVALSVVEAPTAENLDVHCGYSVLYDFGAGAKSGTLLAGIMSQANNVATNARNAAMEVYGRAYIKTADGYTFGAVAVRSLQQQVEAIDAILGDLSATQKAGIAAFYNTYKAAMESWNIPNLRGEQLGDIVIAVPVKSENGVVTETVTVEADGMSVTVPFGTLLENGATELTLNVTKKAQSDSGIEAAAGETLMPFDVHVEGVSSENTVPLTVALGKVMPENLNMGNYSIYHVEKGETKEMTLVSGDEEFTAHNQFKYTLDGELTLHMATFSEVAALTEEPKWEGKRDYSWYTNAAAPADENGTVVYEIRNADQLAAFGAIVGGMAEGIEQDSFSGKTVILLADIDLADNEENNDSNKIFYPIGYNSSDGKYEKTGVAVTTGFYNFCGTFDGNGNTISNFYQNTWEMKGDNNYYDATLQYYRDGMGLFGRVYGATIKNLTVNNFKSDGEYTTTGVIAAYADFGATFANIAITNCNPRVYNIGNGGIVGCAGWYTKGETDKVITFKNITVDNTNKISALWGTYDASCGGILGQYYQTSGQSSAGNPKNAGVHFENCHVAAVMDVNNDVCGNYQYYWYRYCGMFIGSLRENTTDSNGYTVGNAAGITANNCTYTVAQWKEYHYCELVKNGKASYTHDHKMSRLTPISSLDEIKGGDTWTKTGNYLLDDGTNKTCYHIVQEGNVLKQHLHTDSGTEVVGGETILKENNQIIYLPFNQLMTGYGWGVKAYQSFEGIEPSNAQLAASEKKFTAIVEDGHNIPEGVTSVAVADLFTANANVNQSTVHMYISPVGEDSTVAPAYVCTTNGYLKDIGNLSISGSGAAKITITDYYYCIPTVLYVTVGTVKEAAEKFEAVEGVEQDAYTTITLGELFNVKDGAEIGNITALVINPKNVEQTITATATDWASKTIDLTKDGEWIVTISDDDKYCEPTTVKFTVVKADLFKSKFTNDYICRVGNVNTVAWGTIFGTKDNLEPINLNVEIVNKYGDAAGAFTSGKIQFTGNGIVELTISADAAKPVSIYLEVVTAKNVVTYSELKDESSVLLANITMSSGGTYRLTGNKVLYGNGFSFDVRSGAYAGVDYDYMSYVVYVEDSKLDNVKVDGAVYPEVGGSRSEDYNRAIVMTSGDCVITNSYISNGASPVRNGGNLELINTTLLGGAYANLDLRNGHLILDNVTTVNQVDGNEKYVSEDETKNIVGMGIVVYQEGGTESLKITIRNTLTQYNYLSKEEAEELFTDTYSSEVRKIVYGADFNSYRNDGWVNFGIISMNNYFTEDDLVDERTDKAGYTGQSKEITLINKTRNCYVYTFKPATAATVPYAGYVTAGQGAIAPDAKFDFKTKNYIAKTEGSNDYCYADGGIVYISMDEGDTFTWDTAILEATKAGTTLDYTVKVDGTDYTGKTITFNGTGTHTVEYSYADGNNYRLENGAVVTYPVKYTKTIAIEVTAVKPSAKHAVFSFGANGTAYTAKTVMVGDKTYVMPDVTATVSGKIGSTTVNGTTVYYPITEMYTSDNKTAHTGSWYACFPIFKNALQIIDYADGGTGDAVTYNQTKVTTVNQIPSTLKAVNPTSAFLYQMNSTNYPPPTDPTAVSGAVCYTSNRNGLTASNTRTEFTITAEYTYTDNAGTVYYYYVGYHCAEQTNGSTPCVTPGTLITLADGAKIPVEDLNGTEELLVWNLEKGCYESAPIVFVDTEEESEYEVIRLKFADGTVTEIVYEHGFFDVTTGEYVYLDASNAADYIGHSFVKQGELESNTWETVELVDVVVETRVTTTYSPVTFSQLCYYVDGMLSMPGGIEGLFNIFEVDVETMTYNAEKMAADIETYGLFTYEDFAAMIPEEAFYAFNGAWLKVAMGKGMLTWEDIEYMANRYVPLM